MLLTIQISILVSYNDDSIFLTTLAGPSYRRWLGHFYEKVMGTFERVLINVIRVERILEFKVFVSKQPCTSAILAKLWLWPIKPTIQRSNLLGFFVDFHHKLKNVGQNFAILSAAFNHECFQALVVLYAFCNASTSSVH